MEASRETLCHHTCRFRMEPDRLRIRKKARMEGHEPWRGSGGQGDVLLRSDLNASPAQAAFPRALSQKHT